jgi:hypothetical protein
MPSWIPVTSKVIDLGNTQRNGTPILLPYVCESVANIIMHNLPEMHDSQEMLAALEQLTREVETTMRCDWVLLRAQLLQQWPLLTAQELDETERSRQRIGLLIQKKYNIAMEMVDHYLSHCERTMPLH